MRKKTAKTAVQYNSTHPDVDYPDWLGLLGKFVENSITLTCLAIAGYRIQYSVMASNISNQAWSKGLDAGTYCK